jgi:valyl-tRNA synthetase
MAEADQEILRAKGMLSNANFTSKAPPHVVQQQRDRLAEQQERRARFDARLEALEG